MMHCGASEKKTGGEAHIPCPHFNITIIARGKAKGNSVMGAAAYQSGDKLYSDYEHEWKSGDHLERIVHKEILLPPNAPEAYRDRSTLWNAVDAVDAAEKKVTAQTARRIIMALPKELTREQNIELIRNYCQTSFVDRGMIADFAVHDDNEGNPHAHVLLTIRSLNEQGEWNPKTRTEFILDENGERIQKENGDYQRRCVSWDGWNDRGNCEIWRHEWEVMQNAALEKAGRDERIDMRSFERQGIELAPQVHLGPAASSLERKGIRTRLGDHNRVVKMINSLFSAVRRKIKNLTDWLKELSEVISNHEKIENDKCQAWQPPFWSGTILFIPEILITEDNIKHLPRSHDKGLVREMPDISGRKISILLFSFFHHDLIEYEILWIGQFHVKMLRININGAILESAHNAFYEIFWKMELGPGKNFPVFFFYCFV